ncbi:MAG: hypothetical protein AAF446_06295 [Pseudomonadota bacterium]
MKDAEREELNLESRFDLAYNAAHALSLAALRWHGFRSDRRYLVFQCLPHMLNLSTTSSRILDQAHRKRNMAEYEGYLDIDMALITALLRVTTEVLKAVEELEAIQS